MGGLPYRKQLFAKESEVSKGSDTYFVASTKAFGFKYEWPKLEHHDEWLVHSYRV